MVQAWLMHRVLVISPPQAQEIGLSWSVIGERDGQWQLATDADRRLYESVFF